MIHAYDIGTEVQEKSGRVKKKVDDGKWVGRNRYNWQRYHKQELGDSQKVYHINGDKADDSPRNLVAIEFNRKVYNLRRSKVVWSPRPLREQKVRVNLK